MGYVHDTSMSQFIPVTAMHIVGGVWAAHAGAVAGMIGMEHVAGADVPVINIPIVLPSNSDALKGAYLKSVEIDYAITAFVANTITATMIKITRNADGTPVSHAHPAVTQDLAAGVAAVSVDDHTLTVTLTTPAWIDHDDAYLLVLTCDLAAGTEFMLLGAVANFTLRA